MDLNSVDTKLIGRRHTHWHHAFASSLPAQPPATLLWHTALPLCAPEALALWLHCCGNFQTQIGEPLRELNLEPLFCSSLLASPGPHILLSGFIFGLTVLSLTCQWPVFSLPFPSLPLVSCYCVPSGFVMYVCSLGVWEFFGSHSSAILS